MQSERTPQQVKTVLATIIEVVRETAGIGTPGLERMNARDIVIRALKRMEIEGRAVFPANEIPAPVLMPAEADVAAVKREVSEIVAMLANVTRSMVEINARTPGRLEAGQLVVDQIHGILADESNFVVATVEPEVIPEDYALLAGAHPALPRP